MKKIIFFFVCSFIIEQSFSQNSIEVYPTNWWVGMKMNKIQLMIHAKNATNMIPAFKLPAGGTKLADGIMLKGVHHVENPNYVFLDIEIAKTAKPGIRKFEFAMPGTNTTIDFELKPRRTGNGTAFAQGVTSKDLVYLLMPDRFSNGDPTNDRIAGMRDQTLSRDSIYHRHGGDLQGVIDHLDYLKDLGVTSVWMTPVIENDMPNRTEHGYAFTNHYKIEPRFGGPEAYKKLSDELHKRGMKLIQDAVYNHVGLYHFTVQDPPMKDWLHQWPSFTQTTYKDQTVFDPHAAPSETKQLEEGWFTRQMPDMNQENPFVANYLVQHAIWSVEEFGVDGWRIDTYVYNDLKFMNRCNKALMDEYPKLSLFGETWVHGVLNQSYLCQNNFDIPFKSNLQATTDFQLLFYGIQPTLNEAFGWTEGVNKLYTTTAQDFAYKEPMREVIFLGNHDLPRFYSVIKEDTTKYKMALAWLMTFRGIPQLYYGDEILMTGFTNPDGNVRLDFKGGWPEDRENKFTKEGRTQKEDNIFQYLKRFANFRKNSSAITTGKLMQYVPVNGVYVYFRYDEKQTVMCVMNTSDKPATIDFSKYAERMSGFTKAYDVATGVTFNLEPKLTLGEKYLLVMELKK
ncbi:MAG TPA: glycoside hydrolase family 13 protein [Chitinophagaceae bacterium]|nr:glycoside hydrolase family 13 protein [Chitinophagaceae bacterium]